MGEWAWAAFTVAAAASQTVRNALQRGLTASLGTVGATHVRFLYGFPFAVLFFVVVVGFGGLPPTPDFVFVAWCALGAFAQIFATALMLGAMRERSFVVVTAYTKTEPVQVAVFAMLVLGERPTALVVAAVAVATAGVLVMSWPTRKPGEPAWSWRPALLGIAAGGMFALAAVGFRGAVLEMTAIGASSFVVAATTTLVVGLTIQAGALSLWLALREPKVLADVLGAWRISGFAGFTGALASQFWFLAFALETVARVRTLGLVEVLFAWAISRNVLKQPTRPREAIGMALVVAGVALVLNG